MNGDRLRTIRLIATREVREHVRSPVMWMLFGVALAMCVFASHVGLANWRVKHGFYLELERQRAAERTSGPSLFGWQPEPALRVIRPPNPRTALVGSGADTAPSYWDFGPAGIRSGPVPLGNAALQGEIDLEFIIRIVLGLLALVLAVQSIAGDRSDGSLLALLGQAVRPPDVMIGKVVGAAATLSAALAAVVTVAYVTLWIEKAPLASGDAAITSMMISVSGVLYLLVCWTVGAIFGLLPLNLRAVTVTTFVLWAFGSFISFGAAGAIEQTFWPVRPAVISDAERERLVEGATRAAQVAMGDVFVQALGGPGSWLRHREDMERLKSAESRLEPIWSAFLGTVRASWAEAEALRIRSADRRRRFDCILRTLNPAWAFRGAVREAAGLGVGSRAAWAAALRDYHAELNRRLFENRPRLFVLAPVAAGADEAEPIRRLTVAIDRGPVPSPSALADFITPTRSIADRVRDATPAVLTLFVYVVLFLGVTIRVFSRWAVR